MTDPLGITAAIDHFLQSLFLGVLVLVGVTTVVRILWNAKFRSL